MPKQKINAYLVSGGRFHDIDFARLEILKLLGEHHHVRTKVGNDYSDIEGISQSDFLITYTCDLVPTDEQVAALRGFLERGGRWLALHGTNSILRLTEEGGCRCPDDERPAFFELLGTQFKAHPVIGAYQVDIVEPDHALTRGIEPFETVDEQYLSVRKSAIEVLMETRFAGEATGFVDNEVWEEGTHPVLYTRALGKGEVLYFTLGHCRGHFDLQPLAEFNPIIERCSWNLPVYYEILRRGIVWAMGGPDAT